MKTFFHLFLRRFAPKVIFPFYHAVTDFAAAHYRCLYDARTINDFRNDLDELLNFGDPLSLPDLLKMTEENYFPGRFFLLSFDDGLREVYQYAVPEMEKKKVTASLFINPAFIDNRDLFYRHKAALLTDAATSRESEVLTFFGKNNQRKSIKDLLLQVSYQDREILDEIAVKIGLNFGDYLNRTQPYMNCKELVDLHQLGYDIGGHSLDHPYFPEISLESQLNQAEKSMDFAQDLTKSAIRAFAFPFTDWGVGDDFFKKCNADLSFGTAKIKDDPVPNHFQRLSFEQKSKTAHQILLKEIMAYSLKKMFGLHITQR